MTSLLVSLFFTWFLLGILLPYLRRGLLDHPVGRSSHCYPTPRGGGIAFVLCGVASSALFFFHGSGSAAAFLPLLSAPLAVVGLFDDRYDLSPLWRYGVQLLTAGFILRFSPLVERFGQLFNHTNLLFLCFLVFLLIAITAVINFINFMDGLDGLVAGCMVVNISVLAFALKAPWPLWGLVGSLLGFLLWNWSPAKVFMGDVGSTFLGAVFAGLLLQSSSLIQAFGCLLVATPLLGDASLCVLRRLFAGQRIFRAHRLHLFQRLHQAGWPHARVSCTYITATAVLGLAMLLGGLPWVSCLSAALLLLGVWLDLRVAVPFSVASRS